MTPLSKRPVEELPRLQLEAGDLQGLAKTLMNVFVFQRLQKYVCIGVKIYRVHFLVFKLECACLCMIFANLSLSSRKLASVERFYCLTVRSSMNCWSCGRQLGGKCRTSVLVTRSRSTWLSQTSTSTTKTCTKNPRSHLGYR